MSNYFISQRTANHVLNYMHGNEGYSGGGFTTKLLSAFGHGDEDNKRKLGLGFPEEYAAMQLATRTNKGLDDLRKIAAGDREGVVFI